MNQEYIHLENTRATHSPRELLFSSVPLVLDKLVYKINYVEMILQTSCNHSKLKLTMFLITFILVSNWIKLSIFFKFSLFIRRSSTNRLLLILFDQFLYFTLEPVVQKLRLVQVQDFDQNQKRQNQDFIDVGFR